MKDNAYLGKSMVDMEDIYIWRGHAFYSGAPTYLRPLLVMKSLSILQNA